MKYRRISDALQRHGLQFYYLPKLFRTAGIEQKIRYYAPYLSEKIMAVKRIESNAMLQFLTNRNQVVFDEHLANNYIITGERGLQYFIPLDRELITWEE